MNFRKTRYVVAGVLLAMSLCALGESKPSPKPPHPSPQSWVGQRISSVPGAKWHGGAAEALTSFGSITRSLELTFNGTVLPRWTHYLVALSAPGSRFSKVNPPTGAVNAIVADGWNNKWVIMTDDSARPTELLHFVVIGRLGEPLWFVMEPIGPGAPRDEMAHVRWNICRIFIAADKLLWVDFPNAPVDYMPLACARQYDDE